jgi:hypothetical protein
MNKPIKLDGAVTLSKRQREQQRRARPREKKIRQVVQIAKPIEPTPERKAMGDVEVATVVHHESGTQTEASRIRSWHTMMYNRGKITDDQFRTIQKYKDQWDITERSPLKSNLDRSIAGNDENAGPSLKYLDARKNINHWNARIGRTEAKEFVLVSCQGLGYEGAANALFGDTAKRVDIERIKKTFIKSVDLLEYFMK